MRLIHKVFPWLARYRDDNEHGEPKVVTVAKVEILRGQEEKARLRDTLDRTGNQFRDRISQGR